MGAAGEKYRPSNGAEAEGFQAVWCDNCENDRAFREDPDCADSCSILARVNALYLEDPNYPAEWQHRADGRPCCTAFEPERDPLDREPPTPRCDKTPDMLGGTS